MIACLSLLATLPGSAALHASARPVLIDPALPGGMASPPAPGMFLVAQRDLGDPHFNRSVIYLLEHGPDGSTGLIVNRPSGVKLSDVVSGVRESVAGKHALYFGGPVQHNQVIMLMRNTGQSRQIKHIDGDIYVSADRNVMNRLLAENKPQDELHFYLGHAGWSAGQLARELEHDSWHVIEGDAQAIFNTDPDRLWERLIERLEPEGLYVKAGLLLAT